MTPTGESMEDLGSDHHQAEKVFQQLCELDPDCCLSWVTLGRHYMKTKIFKKALPCFKKSIQLEEHYLLAHLYAGQCLEKLGNASKALETYSHGLSIAKKLNEDGFVIQFQALQSTLQESTLQE